MGVLNNFLHSVFIEVWQVPMTRNEWLFHGRCWTQRFSIVLLDLRMQEYSVYVEDGITTTQVLLTRIRQLWAVLGKDKTEIVFPGKRGNTATGCLEC